MAEIPIACTLAPAQMQARGEEIRALGREALVSVDHGERHVTLRFRPGPEIRERVDAIVAAEAECCAFMRFTVAAGDDAIVVTIEAPQDGEALVRELAYLFSAETTVKAVACTCPSCLNSMNSR
jgi:hypothetical protein